MFIGILRGKHGAEFEGVPLLLPGQSDLPGVIDQPKDKKQKHEEPVQRITARMHERLGLNKAPAMATMADESPIEFEAAADFKRLYRMVNTSNWRTAAGLSSARTPSGSTMTRLAAEIRCTSKSRKQEGTSERARRPKSVECASLQNTVCVMMNHNDTHGADTLTGIWAAALPDDLPGLLDDDTHAKSGWRIEVCSNTRGKFYWRYRQGSGRYRPTIPGGPFDTFSDDRKQAYYDNARRNRQAKERAQAKRAAHVDA